MTRWVARTLAPDPAGQLHRIDQDVPPGRSIEPGMPERGVDLGPGGIPVEELEVLAVLGRFVHPGPELVGLIRVVGEREDTGLLEIAVDVMRAGEVDQCPKVVDTLPLEALE